MKTITRRIAKVQIQLKAVQNGIALENLIYPTVQGGRVVTTVYLN